jgi:CheY-like chemotaxis protein
MLDHDDLKWTAANLTELNRRLQQITRQTEQATQQERGASFQRLNEEVALAAKLAQALFDRITSRILAGATPGMRPAPEPPVFRVVGSVWEKAAASTMVADKFPVGEMKLSETTTPHGIEVLNPSGKRELILVVDDDLEVLERASEMLTMEDYRVVLAKDGFQALQIYSQMREEIALIILDFFLPVMDGDAVFDELKAINPRVQVVLSSGFAEQTKLGSMLSRGLCGFIPKPYTSAKLLDQVQSIIAA